MTIFNRFGITFILSAGAASLIGALAQLALGAMLPGVFLLLAAAALLGAAAFIRRSGLTHLLYRAIESTPVGLCILDTESRIVICNDQFAAMYDVPKAQLATGVGVKQRHQLFECDGNVQHRAPYLRINELSDGRFIEVSRHEMAGGGSIEVHKDITTERLTENEVDQAVIVAITDVKGNITYANDKFCRISGYTREELFGKNHRILKSGQHHNELFRDMYRCLAKGQVWRGELCNRAKSGKLYWVDTVITPQLGRDGRPTSYMAIRIDITARKEAEAQLSFAATHDSLTQLLNRSALLDQTTARLAPSEQRSQPIVVYLLDLDGFKTVNDAFGHGAGDQLLRQVGRRLLSLARAGDLVARLGGDEFAIVRAVDGRGRESCSQFSQRLVEAIAQPFELEDRRVNIGASVGSAICPEDGVTAEALLKKADLALYAAKASGKNGFRLFRPEMLDAIEDDKALELELLAALDRDEFEVHYQPILDAATGSISAAEALLRWRHPTRGTIPPARFIPAAERTGVILPIGEWVMRRACRDAVSWPASVRLALNISAIQFKRGKLYEAVMQSLLDSGLSPQRLELELTETALLEHQPEQLRTCRRLKNIGVSLVLDDFGTGYSSANYLTKFPFDKIKIDKSFVQNLNCRKECAAVTASAIALAKGLGIPTTAEGIESQEQYERLRSMGVDFVQGYLFGRPMPCAKLVASLASEGHSRAEEQHRALSQTTSMSRETA